MLYKKGRCAKKLLLIILIISVLQLSSCFIMNTYITLYNPSDMDVQLSANFGITENSREETLIIPAHSSVTHRKHGLFSYLVLHLEGGCYSTRTDQKYMFDDGIASNVELELEPDRGVVMITNTSNETIYDAHLDLEWEDIAASYDEKGFPDPREDAHIAPGETRCIVIKYNKKNEFSWPGQLPPPPLSPSSETFHILYTDEAGIQHTTDLFTNPDRGRVIRVDI